MELMNWKGPLQLRELPMSFELSVPELSVPALGRAVRLVPVGRQLAVVEQDVSHICADGQGHAWAKIRVIPRDTRRVSRGFKQAHLGFGGGT